MQSLFILFFFGITIIQTSLFSISPSLSTKQTSLCQAENLHQIERRAALDIGSGQIKIKVADVDIIENKIVRVLFSDATAIGLREAVAKSLDGRLSAAMQDKTVEAISKLLQKAAYFHPKSCYAVATESLRLAKNNESLITKIKKETGLSVTIISQKEEGILGFISAVNEANLDGKDLDAIISWDFGGGSFQITTKDKDHYSIYQGRLGKVPMKNALLNIQKKDPEKGWSPNPVSQREAAQAIQYIKDNVKGISKELQQKLSRTGGKVLGIGIHPLWGMKENISFSKERILRELRSRLNLDDEAISRKDGIEKKYAAYRVSNLILAYGVMEALGITEVQYVGTQGANATGVLLSPRFWQESEDENKKTRKAI